MDEIPPEQRKRPHQLFAHSLLCRGLSQVGNECAANHFDLLWCRGDPQCEVDDDRLTRAERHVSAYQRVEAQERRPDAVGSFHRQAGDDISAVRAGCRGAFESGAFVLNDDCDVRERASGFIRDGAVQDASGLLGGNRTDDRQARERQRNGPHESHGTLHDGPPLPPQCRRWRLPCGLSSWFERSAPRAALTSRVTKSLRSRAKTRTSLTAFSKSSLL